MKHSFKSGRDRRFPENGHRPDHDQENSHRRGSRRGGRLLDYGELKLLLLAIIAERPSHGYELIKSVEGHFCGSYTPSPGVLYPTLAWLDDVGYTTFETTEGNRKIHRITPEGEAFLIANRVAIENLRTRGGSDGRRGRAGAPALIVQAMDHLKTALRIQLYNNHSDEAGVTRVAAIIEEAARRIEGGK